MTLEEIKKDHPEAYEKLMEQANLIAKNEAEKAVEEQVKALETEKATILSEKEETEKKLQEAQAELDKFNAEKALREKKDNIASKLAEAKIADKVSEEFVTLLEGMEDEVIEKLIADKAETFASKTTKVDGFGPTGKKEPEPEKKNYKQLWFK